MINVLAGSRIWLVAGVTDKCCSFNGLAAKVQITLGTAPNSGHMYIFCGRSADMIKVQWADRYGLCLFTQRLEHGYFCLAGSPLRKSPPDAGAAVHASERHLLQTSAADGMPLPTEI